MNKKAISAAVVVLLVATLSACSSDDSASSDTTEKQTPTTTMATTSTMEAEPSADIVQTATEAGGFTTLVKAVEAAGLVETLSGKGPFTVFAPTDEAFAKLPAGTIDTLLADPTGQLKSILTYHVISGEVMAKDVAGMDGQEVETVNGANLKIGVGANGEVTLTDAKGNTVNVTKTDIKASNGVVHVIDGVLMP